MTDDELTAIEARAHADLVTLLAEGFKPQADTLALAAEVRRLRALIPGAINMLEWLASERDRYDLEDAAYSALLAELKTTMT